MFGCMNVAVTEFDRAGRGERENTNSKMLFYEDRRL